MGVPKNKIKKKKKICAPSTQKKQHHHETENPKKPNLVSKLLRSDFEATASEPEAVMRQSESFGTRIKYKAK
jgi:hypothetical protein